MNKINFDVLNASEQFVRGLSTEAVTDRGFLENLRAVAKGEAKDIESMKQLTDVMAKVALKERHNPSFTVTEAFPLDPKYVEPSLLAKIIRTAQKVVEASTVHSTARFYSKEIDLPKPSLELLAKNQRRVSLAFEALRDTAKDKADVNDFEISDLFKEFQ